MKRLLTIFLWCMSILCCVPVYASPYEADFINTPVTDDAGYLTYEEFEQLKTKLERIREEYDFDVAIYTEYIMSGYDAQSTADDLYDYNFYGAGEDRDGILLYICSESREYYITTHAKGIYVFNDHGIAYLMDHIQPLLEDDQYYQAMDTFANLAEELLEMAANGQVYNEEKLDTGYVVVVVGSALLFPLLIAYLMMKTQISKMKTAKEERYAQNYMKQDSRHITNSRDIFLYSHITKTAKPKKSSSSTTHRSSSGRTHGGGGGRF